MSSFFVDTERLSERCREGSRLEQPVREDLSRLRSQISEIRGSMEELGETERGAELARLMDEIEKTVCNILDVCVFDRFAAEEYERLRIKLDDMVSAIEI
ncbi:MAG: hypothetical protein IJH41_03650 [Eubacterium sp.]|nr:hypothetical protein [Eubacterium sp.]